MSLALPRRTDDDRRAQILTAAERAFVAYGFHAATMSQVAEAAGMSAGNLYRYFPSKEAIVEGLCELDQASRSAAFAALAEAPDLHVALRAVLSEQVLGCPPEKARMMVEIWAEAGRNPRVAAFTQAIDAEVQAHIVDLVNLAKRRGAARPEIDAVFVARALFTLVAGLFKRKALEPTFDPNQERAMTLGLFEALFDGVIGPQKEH